MNKLIFMQLKKFLEIHYLKSILFLMNSSIFLFKNNSGIISRKLKSGAVLVTLTTVLYGCKSGDREIEKMCYGAVAKNDSVYSEDSLSITLDTSTILCYAPKLIDDDLTN
ncbi:MAG: hypothetical protein ABIJ97_13135 [Bacteroidota bacterium]